MHIIFLLISLFSILFSFTNLYNFDKEYFEIKSTKDNYILTLKGQQFLKYKQEGFKFFIPYFTKEFNLKILRYNSTGYINGLLSSNLNFSNIVDENNPSNYITDFKTGKQLLLLLQNKTIPYYKKTAISIEMYNIPNNISKKLNRFFYFKRIPIKNNTLEYILYSGYIILDKKSIDKLYPNSKNPIKEFLSQIYQLKLTKQTIKKKSIKIKKVVNPPYRLILHPILYMKDFGYTYQNNNIITNFDEISLNIVNKLDNIKELIIKNLNKIFIFNVNEKISTILISIENLKDHILNTHLKIDTDKCIFKKNLINTECFKNSKYFQNYIYYSIKNNSLPNEKLILKYANYKTLNDIGKYYFERAEYEKALFYLQKSYNKNKNSIINHNLGVFYASFNPLRNLTKAINFFKQSTFDEDYYNLGIYYYIGAGVKEDNKKAREYFKKSNINYAKFNYEVMKKFKIGEK